MESNKNYIEENIPENGIVNIIYQMKKDMERIRYFSDISFEFDIKDIVITRDEFYDYINNNEKFVDYEKYILPTRVVIYYRFLFDKFIEKADLTYNENDNIPTIPFNTVNLHIMFEDGHQTSFYGLVSDKKDYYDNINNIFINHPNENNIKIHPCFTPTYASKEKILSFLRNYCGESLANERLYNFENVISNNFRRIIYNNFCMKLCTIFDSIKNSSRC